MTIEININRESFGPKVIPYANGNDYFAQPIGQRNNRNDFFYLYSFSLTKSLSCIVL